MVSNILTKILFVLMSPLYPYFKTMQRDRGFKELIMFIGVLKSKMPRGWSEQVGIDQHFIRYKEASKPSLEIVAKPYSEEVAICWIYGLYIKNISLEKNNAIRDLASMIGSIYSDGEAYYLSFLFDLTSSPIGAMKRLLKIYEVYQEILVLCSKEN